MSLKHEVIHNSIELPIKIVAFKRSWQGRSYPWHWHENIEIIYNVNSNIVYHVESEEYQLQPDQILLINSYAPHRLETVSNNGFYTLCLIDYNFIEKWTGNKYYNDFLFNTLIGSADDQQKRKLVQILLKMTELYQELTDLNRIKINGLCFEMLSILFEYYQVPVHTTSDINLDIAITRYIKENIREHITLKDIAHKFSYNYAYLSRLFHQRAGISFTDYITALRIGLSMVDLLDYNLPIQQVAVNSGFSTTRSYLRAFQNRYHTSPSKFRKNHFNNPNQVIKNYLV